VESVSLQFRRVVTLNGLWIRSRIMDSIADYGSFDAAERFLSDLNAKCTKLAQFPGMGRRRDELSPGLRSFPIDRHLIFYCEIEMGIEITRVVSGYQDLERLFSEEDDRPSS
jgi:toxin ParE1/3/4